MVRRKRNGLTCEMFSKNLPISTAFTAILHTTIQRNRSAHTAWLKKVESFLWPQVSSNFGSFFGGIISI